MARLDQLPPDQRAVLQLLLKQGKSYGEIASLLRIERSAVKARAHDALSALGPEDAGDLSDDRRDEIGDHLLGQQDESQAAATRSFLEGSPAGRAWGRVVSSELRELAPAGLPEIPAEGGGGLDGAHDALEARRAARGRHERSSKLGGLLLLVGGAIVVAVVLVLLLTSGGDDKKDTGPVGGGTGTTSTTPATTTGTATTPTVEAQVNLFPPGGGKKPLGVANVVTQQGRRGIALVGQDVPATNGKFAYAMWLTGGATPKRLGFFGEVKANGRMQGFVLTPANFASYSTLVVSRETQRSPKAPGPIILSGKLPKK
jgi:Sigma-70, region 4